MKQFLTISIFFVVTFLGAQNTFQEMFVSSAIPKALMQTSDGGYLVATYSDVIKTDAAGQVLWMKTLSIPTGTLQLVDAGECAGGGYYLLGSGSDNVNPAGLFVTRLDASGNLLWTKLYPGTNNSYNYSKLRQTSDGGFIISESSYSKMGAIRTDGNGNVTWACSFTGDTSTMPKNPSFDCELLNDGSMIFTGKRTDDICLVKTDPAGQVQWTKVMNDGSSYYHTNSVAVLSGGGFAMVGYDDNFPFAMRTDASGNIMWFEDYTSYGSFEQVFEQQDSNLLVRGGSTTGTDLNFSVLDVANGAVLSASTFSHPSSFAGLSKIHPTSDNGFVLSSNYSDTYGGSGLALMKTDSAMLFSCGFITDSLQPSSASSMPSTLPVTIFRQTENISAVNFTIVETSMPLNSVSFCQVLGVEDHAQISSVNVYPSPVTAGEALHLDLQGNGKQITMSVFDVNGKIVRTQSLASTNGMMHATLETGDLSRGIYLVQVMDENGTRISSTKFIVE